MAFADPTHHPRPQLIREHWWSLDGAWDYAADPAGSAGRQPADIEFDRTITVPYAPEAPASGIGNQAKCRTHWYRRTVEIPDELMDGDRLFLRFNAVDHRACVWIDGHEAGHHEGGYTPFAVELTGLVRPGTTCEVVVRADDDPDELDKPRGKQTWRERPHGIWYPRTSGIWQTVWLERVPAVSIGDVRWTGDVDRLQVGVEVSVDGPVAAGTRLALRLTVGDQVLVDDVVSVDATGRVERAIGLADRGQFERSQLLWHPSSPVLIDAHLELQAADGTVLDAVRSYTGLRSVEARDGRIWVNGRVLRLRLVLDQGYWADTGLTPPDSEALRRDVELAKALGFNGVRKHQKVEDPRFLAWADRLGLLVWDELPSAHTFSRRLVRRAAADFAAMIERDRNHPSVIAWVPFNESWSVWDLPRSSEQQAFVRTLANLAHALDGTRPVVANDGWESVGGDIVAVHDYDGDPDRLRARYGSRQAVDELVGGVGPSGRRLVVEPPECPDPPVLLTEFGGIAVSSDGETWGYHQVNDGIGLAARYAELLDAIRSSPVLAGFCYTQLTDTYQEANGLLTMDRQPKAEVEAIRRANRGR